MKKFVAIVLALALVLSLAACGEKTPDDNAKDVLVMGTSADYAPYEFMYPNDKGEMVYGGIDISVAQAIADSMGKELEIQNMNFDFLLNNLQSGKCDMVLAAIEVTPERLESADFSDPYYTSIQYVILPADSDIATKTVDGVTYIVWEALEGKTVATQTDTTGWIYADCEIDCEGGVLYGTDTKHEAMDSANVAAEALGTTIDAIIVDQLPAQYIVSNSSKDFVCYPLYYSGAEGEADEPVIEHYAIAVTKGDTELLNAINEVLAELLVKDANGQTQIEKMVMAHMGMN